jgi:hypothetical protein
MGKVAASYLTKALLTFLLFCGMVFYTFNSIRLTIN